MGKKVNYCRAKPGEDGKTKLFKSDGIIVGIIIAATKRIQIMVRDSKEKDGAAISLDLMCINPTNNEADAYFAHHKKLKSIVEEHNEAQKTREQEKIKEVDIFNHAFFGQPLDV